MKSFLNFSFLFANAFYLIANSASATAISINAERRNVVLRASVEAVDGFVPLDDRHPLRISADDIADNTPTSMVHDSIRRAISTLEARAGVELEALSACNTTELQSILEEIKQSFSSISHPATSVVMNLVAEILQLGSKLNTQTVVKEYVMLLEYTQELLSALAQQLSPEKGALVQSVLALKNALLKCIQSALITRTLGNEAGNV